MLVVGYKNVETQALHEAANQEPSTSFLDLFIIELIIKRKHLGSIVGQHGSTPSVGYVMMPVAQVSELSIGSFYRRTMAQSGRNRRANARIRQRSRITNGAHEIG